MLFTRRSCQNSYESFHLANIFHLNYVDPSYPETGLSERIRLRTQGTKSSPSR